jgi:hypothetical protein
MSGLGQGAFNGNESSLKGAMAAAMKVIGTREQRNDLPEEVTQEQIDECALDVRANARTLEDKNNIVRKHFGKIELTEAATHQAIAAFESVVMKRVGG